DFGFGRNTSVDQPTNILGQFNTFGVRTSRVTPREQLPSRGSGEITSRFNIVHNPKRHPAVICIRSSVLELLVKLATQAFKFSNVHARSSAKLRPDSR